MLDTLEDMKVVILAGGLGTRLAEETDVKPKPMVEIGGRPILWHIMMQYGFFGLKNFVIALGYKGEVIKKYMADYSSLGGNLTVNMRTGQVLGENNYSMDWMVELIDTGPLTETGGRLKRIAKRLGNKTFMLTYGDGVSNVDIRELLAFHRSHGKLATLTAVRPPARFGHMDFEGDQVSRFSEKSQTDVGWINGGFFVLEPQVIDYIDSEDMKLERDPLERLAAEGQLMAYKHPDFWQCMDTLRDKQLLQKLWDNGEAPWKVWEREHANNGHRP